MRAVCPSRKKRHPYFSLPTTHAIGGCGTRYVAAHEPEIQRVRCTVSHGNPLVFERVRLICEKNHVQRPDDFRPLSWGTFALCRRLLAHLLLYRETRC
ncbi:unnamed protein product [Scytosiphon promiscuus]